MKKTRISFILLSLCLILLSSISVRRSNKATSYPLLPAFAPEAFLAQHGREPPASIAFQTALHNFQRLEQSTLGAPPRVPPPPPASVKRPAGRKNSPFANLRRFLLRNGASPASASKGTKRQPQSPQSERGGAEHRVALLDESNDSVNHAESIIDVDEAMSSGGSALPSRHGTPSHRGSGISTPVS